jgi:hypothetical protein
LADFINEWNLEENEKYINNNDFDNKQSEDNSIVVVLAILECVKELGARKCEDFIVIIKLHLFNFIHSFRVDNRFGIDCLI